VVDVGGSAGPGVLGGEGLAAGGQVRGPGLGEQVVDVAGEGCWCGDVDQVGVQGAQGGQVGGGYRPSGGQVFQGFEGEAAVIERAGV
jgi:hypothetical protein